jgi:hypothetical protein
MKERHEAMAKLDLLAAPRLLSGAPMRRHYSRH